MCIMSIDEFNVRVMELIKKRGWSRYRLARESGIPQSTLYSMIENKSEPGLETIQLIARALDVSVDYLLNTDTELDNYAFMIEISNKANALGYRGREKLLSYADGLIDADK